MAFLEDLRWSYDFLLVRHATLAMHAALLFAAGVFAGIPVIWFNVKPLQWLPVQVFRLVSRLMGRAPGILRMTLVIWLFNSAAMFVYMASGVHPMLVKVVGIWVGMNVVVAAVAGGREEETMRALASWPEERWRPSAQLGWACGGVVLVLELPAFWYAIAMGLSLSHEVQSGAARYLDALSSRAAAYLALIVPALLVSALCESLALRAGAPTGG
jgi:hypothetical protein